MVMFPTVLHPIAAVLLSLVIIYFEFLGTVAEDFRWIRTTMHLCLFLLCSSAFVPYFQSFGLQAYLGLFELSMLGLALGLSAIVLFIRSINPENKLMALKKRRVALKVPLLFAMVLLTASNHFGQVYSYYLFWILCLAFLPIAYNLDKNKEYFYFYGGFVFSVSASFLISLNTDLSFYWMRAPQSSFLVLGLIFLLAGVTNVSKAQN